MENKINLTLKELLEFTKFIRKFQKIERSVMLNGLNRKENDAEHSYQVAMLSWFILNYSSLDYNLEKIIIYSLIHDLVEIYAGDVPTFNKKNIKISKEQKHLNELKSLEIINSEFPFIGKHIDTYEKMEEKEAIFVKTVDKIITPLNLILDDGLFWKQKNITFSDFLKYKEPKINKDPDVYKLYLAEIEPFLEKNKKILFF